MTEDWCRQKLTNLQIKDRRVETLSEIRNRLTELSALEARISANFLSSPEIFDCLEDPSTSEQSHLACDILSICMSSLDLDRTDYSQFLKKSLHHTNPNVQALALDEILKAIKKTPAASSLDNEIILSVISCLDSKESNVGITAVEILSIILLTCYDDGSIRSAFLERLNGEDMVRCRVYEVAVNLAKSSSTMMNNVQDILDKTLAELDCHDVLLQLNILELLVALAEQNHGLVYLENKKVFEKISKRIEQIEESPLDRFLIPGFMKFFGKIAYAQPQKIIVGYPNMIQCLFDCLASEDVSILPTAFDTLGNLAHSSQGKILLETNYSDKLKETFEGFSSYLKNLPTDLKNRGFSALVVIFKTDGKVSKQISEITQRWCSHLSGSTDLRFLLDFCKNPFPDIKVACLSFIQTLCSYDWGIIALKNTAGFVEYLLDRRVEFDKDAKFVKYEIISILAESTVFDAHTMLQLQKYVADGPHYVEGIVEVAIGGS